MNPRLSYREATVAGASPLRLVILLYEQVMEDLRRALAAQKNANVETRTQEINHAILVIGHLEATLDKVSGGVVAANLERFYQQVRSGLVEAQARQSEALLEKQISILMEVHGAWLEAERQMVPQPPATQGNAEPTGTSTEWRA